MSAAEAELSAQLAEMGWSCTRHGPNLVFERKDIGPAEGIGADAGGNPVIFWHVSLSEVATRWAGGRVTGIGQLASVHVAEMLEVLDGSRGELRDGPDGWRVYPI